MPSVCVPSSTSSTTRWRHATTRRRRKRGSPMSFARWGTTCTPLDRRSDMERDLQWDFFDYLPVVLQDASTREVLMVQYMTQEGLERTIDERSMWLWSRSREQFWMAGRNGGGYELGTLQANCMGDSLL